MRGRSLFSVESRTELRTASLHAMSPITRFLAQWRNWPGAGPSALARQEGIDFSRWPPLDRYVDAQMRFQIWLGIAIVAATFGAVVVAEPVRLRRPAASSLSLVLALQLLTLALPARLRSLRLVLEGAQIVLFAGVLVYLAGTLEPEKRIFHLFAAFLLLGIATPTVPFRPALSAIFVAGYLATFALMLPGRLPEGMDYPPLMLLAAVMGIGSWILACRTWRLTTDNLVLAQVRQRKLEELEKANDRLVVLASHDPLTGLANRRHCSEVFTGTYGKGVGTGAALLLLDIDHFKRFNDSWGHQAGDDCLRAVAATIAYFARRYNGIAARFGGEEFVMIFSASSPAQASGVAEDLRVAIERIEIPCDTDGVCATCSVSIGVAVHGSEGVPTLQALLAEADSALYAAKHSGRNRVQLAA